MKASRSLNFGLAFWQRALAIFAVVTLLQMPYNWMFQQPASEIELLALARQIAEPGWIPQDWYLALGERADLPFRAIVWPIGMAARALGWSATIAIGRLLCYGLLAVGLAIVTDRLDLRPGTSTLAIGLWLGFSRLVPIESAPRVYVGFAIVAVAVLLLVCTGRFPNLKRHYLKLFLLAFGLLLSANDPQSLVAGALLVPNFSLASIAGSLMAIALGLFLADRRYAAAAIAGVAASFHATGGGCGFLTMFLCWLLEDVFLGSLRTKPNLKTAIPFAIGAIAMWPFLWASATENALLSDVLASEVRVLIRFTRLLDPQNWNPHWWLKLGTYLLVLALSIYMVAAIRRRSSTAIDRGFETRRALAFLLVSALPFGVGLAIAPFDRTGAFLQYAPFRFFDAMLPLFTLLFFARAMQNIGAPGLNARGFDRLCVLLLLPIVLYSSFNLMPFLTRPTHGASIGTTEAERALYAWVRDETPPDATIVAPPDLSGIQVFGERATVVAFKFLPRATPDIVEWFARLDDITASAAHRELEAIRNGDRRLASNLVADLARTYARLDRDRVFELLDRYEATCFITTAGADFVSAANLEPDYRNADYAAYCPSDRASR